MRALKKLLKWLLLLAALAASAAGALAWWAQQPLALAAPRVEMSVPPGASLKVAAQQAPGRVGPAIEDLLARTPGSMTLDDVADFHHRFESIHPFQDGNGRVGRMLMFQQCLRNGLMPFIVLDATKLFYYRGLNEYEHQPGFLRETLHSLQDDYYARFAPFVEVLDE